MPPLVSVRPLPFRTRSATFHHVGSLPCSCQLRLTREHYSPGTFLRLHGFRCILCFLIRVRTCFLAPPRLPTHGRLLACFPPPGRLPLSCLASSMFTATPVPVLGFPPPDSPTFAASRRPLHVQCTSHGRAAISSRIPFCSSYYLSSWLVVSVYVSAGDPLFRPSPWSVDDFSRRSLRGVSLCCFVCVCRVTVFRWWLH